MLVERRMKTAACLRRMSVPLTPPDIRGLAVSGIINFARYQSLTSCADYLDDDDDDDDEHGS